MNTPFRICLVQWEDYLQEEVSQSHWVFSPCMNTEEKSSGFNVLISWLAHICWAVQWETWSLGITCVGMPVSTRKVSSYQPLPFAKCLGLSSSLSRCSNTFDQSPWYIWWLCLDKACQGLHLLWWVREEKNVSFQGWLLSIPGRGWAPSAPGVVYGNPGTRIIY